MPLNRSLARALEDLLRERADPDDDKFLFPGVGDDAKVAHDPENLLGRGQHVEGLLDPDALRRRFKTAMETAGVKRELSLKHLRHTYCSQLARSGVSPWQIQEAAGHVSITTTQMYIEVFAPKPGHADAVDAAFGEPAETEDHEEPTSGDEQERLAELIRALTPEQLAEALTQALTRQEASA